MVVECRERSYTVVTVELSEMQSIEATKFKKQCLTLLDGLDPDGLVITVRGKPVARVVPFRGTHADLIGSLHHKVTVKGDLSSTGVPWNASPQP